MHEIENISKEISLTRRELKNIRQEVMKLRANMRDEVKNIKRLFSEPNDKKEKNSVLDENERGFQMIPVGFISSCFKNKNGIPRQPSLCQSAKASLEINKTFFTNPEHSLIGLSEFSHIWILFIFNKNTESSVKAKVHPPRLNGKSVGVFSTRSPHRPCAIGLSLIKLDKVVGNRLFLSGVDMLDGTPVLDIKPYIASYDTPKLYRSLKNSSSEDRTTILDTSSFEESVIEANCCTSLESHAKEQIINTGNQDSSKYAACKAALETESPTKCLKMLLQTSTNQLEVIFTERANMDIEKFHSPYQDHNCDYCLHFITDTAAAKQAIVDVLQNDPRSVYRKNKCSDKLYFFEIDSMHVTCWFDDNIAEVLRIKRGRNVQT